MRTTVFHQLAHLCALISNWFSIWDLFFSPKETVLRGKLFQIRTKSICHNGESVISDEHFHSIKMEDQIDVLQWTVNICRQYSVLLLSDHWDAGTPAKSPERLIRNQQ